MPASLGFHSGSSPVVNASNIDTVIYEDGVGNKYTLNFSAPDNPALKFLPKGGTANQDEIDFSNLTGLVGV